MYLDDALARRKEIKVLFAHHEQTCGMSADAYSRITGKLGVALVTAGPGSINVVNGLVGGWCDSAPMMVISGQSALNCVKYQEESGIRQYGIQGIYIRPFVEKATKYFVTVDDPARIQYYLEKAYYLATTGRPGPVWIDVPLDIQRMEVPSRLLTSYFDSEEYLKLPKLTFEKEHEDKIISLLKTAKRPLIVAGQGIAGSKCQSLLRQFLEKYQIPLITTRLGIDIIESAHPLYVGRPGNYGERSANIAVQNADVLLCIGTRLATAAIGHNSKEFGKNARKIVVDIDEKELNKPIFDIDVKVHADCREVLEKLLAADFRLNNFSYWVKKCQRLKQNYPVVLEEYKQSEEINSYYFTDRLCALADSRANIVVDTGSCFHVVCQTWKVKPQQHFLTTGGLSSMGWWVAGIGASVTNQDSYTIIITGDGSLQMNIQDLACIRHNNLPVKLFVFNNNGYLLIRQTQRNFMEGRLFGESPKTGVWCPDLMKIADAYEIKKVRISSKAEIDSKIKEALEFDGPVICEVMMPEWQLIVPRVSSEKKPDGSLVSHNFEDMFPFLPEAEMQANMRNDD